MAEQDTPKTERQKTIDLSEWQKKNQAYLDKRAKEKAEKNKAQKDKEEKEESKASKSKEKDLDEETEHVAESASDEEESEGDVKKDEEEKDQNQSSDEEPTDEDEDSEDGDASEKSNGEDEDGSETEETPQEDAEEHLNELLDGEGIALEKKMRALQQRALVLKATPILLLALVMILIGAYFISPWSRTKHFKVTGNEQLAKADILAASGVLDEDYTVTSILQQGAYANSIKMTLPLVKSAKVNYQFPVTFNIEVEEYYTIAYVKDGQNYHSVLSSGDVLADQISEDKLPPASLVIQMTDLAMVKKLVLALDLLDDNLVAKMQRIELSATPASKDLLRILTVEGHDILVPLGEVGKKLSYYEKILPNLTVPSIIDMEVGLYSYPK